MRAAGFIPRVFAWPPPWAKAEAADQAEEPKTEEATLETTAEDAEEVEEAVKEEVTAMLQQEEKTARSLLRAVLPLSPQSPASAVTRRAAPHSP